MDWEVIGGTGRAATNSIGISSRKQEIVPPDALVLQPAADVEPTLGLSGQDAIVLASVSRHLKANRPDESRFLNRNSRDFDDPDIRERFEGLHSRSGRVRRRTSISRLLTIRPCRYSVCTSSSFTI